MRSPGWTAWLLALSLAGSTPGAAEQNGPPSGTAPPPSVPQRAPPRSAAPREGPAANRPPQPRPPAPGGPPSREAICMAVQAAAAANDLPIEFFTRLIWQESRFDPRAVSHKGAQGVAQFMPKPALWRGLAEPFDPVQAIAQAAA